jgi:twitching motility protein PilT
MEDEFAGEALDGLLNVLVELGGDQLLLQSNAEPVARLGERKLRVTLPETSNATLQTLCGRMATAHTARSGKPSSFTYQSKGHGAFSLDVDGGFAPDGQVRIHIRRLVGKTRAAAAVLPTPVAVTSVASAPDTAVPATAVASAAPPTVVFAERTVRDGGSTQQRLDWFEDAEIATILRQALDLGATDLHLTDGESPRLRCAHGLIVAGSIFDGVGRLLSAEQRRAVDAGQSLDLGATFESRARLRVNVFRAQTGLCAAFRFLPLRAPGLETLGLPSELLGWGDLPHGLVLICGTTGSGKSTTLAALLQDRVRKRARHVITLESPIEYLLDGGERSLVRQREVGRHVPTFAAGLRDALREDPDDLVIGEMRDPDTIGLALTAAETGHLVWSSLHSRSARSAIERIIDQVPPPSQRQVRGQLADSLRVVISQRLIRVEGEGSRALGAARPRPVIAAEVMTVTPAVAHLIREGKTEQLNVAIHSGKDAGMLPLEKDLARLVKQGKLSRAAARAQADDPTLFDRYA